MTCIYYPLSLQLCYNLALILSVVRRWYILASIASEASASGEVLGGMSRQLENNSNEGKGAAAASSKGEGKPGVQDMTEQAYPHKYLHSRFQSHMLCL